MKYFLLILISLNSFASSLTIAQNRANNLIIDHSNSFKMFVENSIEQLKICKTWKCLELEEQYLNKSFLMKTVLATFNCKKEFELLNKFDNYYTSRTQIASRLTRMKRKELEKYQKNYYLLLIDELSFLNNCRV